jgi:hypothetical protein
MAFLLLVLANGTPICAQAFSDDFNRPDGAIGSGWGSWNGSILSGGQLETFGSDGAGGGVFRSFPVTLPVQFSFDFRSESPHPSCDVGNNLPGGGWLIAFNTPGEGFAGAQIEFLQFYGSQFVLRHYQTSTGIFEDTLPSASPDFGPTFVHISGVINKDLSATLTIGSAVYNFGPVANPLTASTGFNLVLSNSSCGGGPFFFDNLLVTTGCHVNPSDVHPVERNYNSVDHQPTEMTATFTPSSLADLESACGFTGFDWVQFITQEPGPSAVQVVKTTANGVTNPVIIVPPHAPMHDPPDGGYLSSSESQECPFLGAYPFYYNTAAVLAADALPDSCRITGYQPDGTLIANNTPIVNNSLNTLYFFDSPNNACLPGGVAFSSNALCQGNQTAPFMAYTTQLVGICGSSPSPLCTSPGLPSRPLYEWTWKDNFNGASRLNLNGTGGVFDVIATTASSFPVEGRSGTGGVTITSINGVLQTPPSVSCAATPNTLWPPNGKQVQVDISGAVTAGTQALVLDSGMFTVSDSEGQTQSSGAVTIDSDRSYSFLIPLTASREGDNKNGRQYAVQVAVSDNIGNVGSCSAVVTVPHDQGH